MQTQQEMQLRNRMEAEDIETALNVINTLIVDIQEVLWTKEENISPELKINKYNHKDKV